MLSKWALMSQERRDKLLEVAESEKKRMRKLPIFTEISSVDVGTGISNVGRETA